MWIAPASPVFCDGGTDNAAHPGGRRARGAQYPEAPMGSNGLPTFVLHLHSGAVRYSSRFAMLQFPSPDQGWDFALWAIRPNGPQNLCVISRSNRHCRAERLRATRRSLRFYNSRLAGVEEDGVR